MKIPNDILHSSSMIAPKVIIYGKLGTFKKVDVVLEAVQKVRENHGVNTKVIVAGSDSHLAEGYIDQIKNQYNDMEGVEYLDNISKKDLADMMIHNLVISFPFTTEGVGHVYRVQQRIYGTMAHKLNDFIELAQEKGYPSATFNSKSDQSLAQAIHQLIEAETFETV
ncbi:MAG: glycosyltransferase [Flavobacteriales bacterium]|nr:glycosyltransferase [Flavobacteriales bacterium]